MTGSSISEEELLFTQTGNAQYVTLNRPKALNALNLDMVRQLHSKLKIWRTDGQTAVVVLKGSGNTAFCSGGDLKSIISSVKNNGCYGKEFFYEEFSLNYDIATYCKPFVPLLNGVTFGGAAGLTVIGQFCVCTEKAVFCMPECAIGLFPDVGSGYYLSRLPGHLGLYLGMTGHRLKGRDIVWAGLGSHFIHSSLLPDLEDAFNQLEGSGLQSVRDLLKDFEHKSIHYSTAEFSLNDRLDQISRCFGADSVEGIIDRLQQDGSDWAMQQIKSINKMSPTSLKVAYRLLREGTQRNLAETLVVEYRLTQKFVADHDFMEGIRAVILDKDNEPKWKPSTLSEVTDERIDFYFSELPDGDELCLPVCAS